MGRRSDERARDRGTDRGRVLFVVNHAAFFVSHRLPLALAARDAGYDVHVASSPNATPRDPAAARHVETLGFPFHPLRMTRKGQNPLREVGVARELARLYRRVAPSLVHHVTIKPVLYGSIAARLAGVPCVVNAVSGLGYVFLDSGGKAAMRRAMILPLYRHAFRGRRTHVVFQNGADAHFFHSRRIVRPDQVTLIPGSGVDLDLFRHEPEPAGVPVVLFPARLLRDKGLLEFVDAARRLRADGVPARFALAGDLDPGNPSAVGRAEVERWVAEGVVEWWGYREDMAGAYAESAVVCLPSYREGMAKVLLEGAAAGRPLVTTDVPGCRDAVREGETGLLVPPRDAAALAAALRPLLGDPVLRARMGEAARADAEARFGVARVVDATLSIYRSLLAA